MSGGLTARRRCSFAAFVLAGLLAMPAIASATTRYAAPGGTAADTVCIAPDAPKCSIGTAAGGTNVLPADEAVILPGNYSDTAGDLNGDSGNPTDGTVQPTAGSVHGSSGEPRPVITVNGLDPMFANPYGAFLLSAGILSDVEINAGAMASSAVTFGFGSSNSIVQRVVARSTRDGAITCSQSQGTIRDSVCLSSGSGGIGVGASVAIAGTYTDNVRNVTAISTGSNSFGVNYFYGTFSPPGPTYTISAKSLIAQGTSQDVLVRASNTGTSVTMTLDHSDYDTSTTQTSGGGAASVTAPGTGTGNITAVPMLAADNYHEAAGSPTINAGATDGNSGTTDVDGQSRAIDTVDIGADELGHPTNTSVMCVPTSLAFGATTNCVFTVTDIGSPTVSTPTGSVALSSSAGGSFTPGCGTIALVGASQANCTADFTPATAGQQQVIGAYSGDSTHEPSAPGSTFIQVAAPPTPPGTGTTPPSKKKKCKKKKHRAAAAKKKCKKKKR
jgi:hypothetical protein